MSVASKANAKYASKAYDLVSLQIKKGNKELLKEVANLNSESMQGYIKKAIEYRYFDDTGKKLDL